MIRTLWWAIRVRAARRAANRSVWLDQVFGYSDGWMETTEYEEGGS